MSSEISDVLKKFFFPKEEIIQHWYAPVDNFQFVTAEFYQTIEKQLTDEEFPASKCPVPNLAKAVCCPTSANIFDCVENGWFSIFAQHHLAQVISLAFASWNFLWDQASGTFDLLYWRRDHLWPLGKVAWNDSGIPRALGGLDGGIYAVRNSFALGLKDLDLKKLAEEAKAPAPPPNLQEHTTRGYKVRGHSPALSVEERTAKENLAIRIMGEAIKRKS